MFNKGNLSFLATVTKSAEEAASLSVLTDQTGQVLPLNPRARAEQLLRLRLRQARERGSRWRQKYREKTPKIVRSTSASLHRAYRQPMPPPPPNSPRYNVLGLPTPLLGVPFINPRAMVASPQPLGSRSKNDNKDNQTDPDGEDFDSDGFRDLESCDGDDNGYDKVKVRSPRKQPQALRKKKEAPLGAEDPPKKYTFFDVFYSAVREEAKRRAAMNFADFIPKTAEAKESPKKRVRFRDNKCTLPEIDDRFENDSLQPSPERHRMTESPRRSDAWETVKYGKSVSESQVPKDSQIEFSTEVNKPCLPPLVFKKDKIITSSLRSNSTHDLVTKPFKRFDNYLCVKQSSYQKSNQQNKKKVNESSVLAKRHQAGTEKIIEKLTERGIQFSTLFDVDKIKGPKNPGSYTNPSTNENCRRNPAMTLDSVLHDACEIANAIRMQGNVTEEQQESPPFCAARRLYLSARNSIQKAGKTFGANSEFIERTQGNRFSPSSTAVRDVWENGIYRDRTSTLSGLDDMVPRK